MHPRKPAFRFNAYRSGTPVGQAAAILARGRQDECASTLEADLSEASQKLYRCALRCEALCPPQSRSQDVEIFMLKEEIDRLASAVADMRGELRGATAVEHAHDDWRPARSKDLLGAIDRLEQHLVTICPALPPPRTDSLAAKQPLSEHELLLLSGWNGAPSPHADHLPTDIDIDDATFLQLLPGAQKVPLPTASPSHTRASWLSGAPRPQTAAAGTAQTHELGLPSVTSVAPSKSPRPGILRHDTDLRCARASAPMEDGGVRVDRAGGGGGGWGDGTAAEAVWKFDCE